eukprot:CAMPEP_0202890972 /NCGR_PEP_ID=MMETSP1392-20130828/1195_1 /ASSEMBLY_ACC=CAM_ASM_000868 /TAXON_ID=225041 /ORGANISM="Chlamydomonas chlamydogama, Strain SAG 11-48b" /LENGTH=133 /DNA_ID=CAMNT_0049574629 /DNA_START=24 /DNA_END=425 /DNA_ORIENTATION=+
MASSWSEFHADRLKDVSAAFNLVQQAVQERQIPDLANVPQSVLATGAYTGVIGFLFLLLLIPRTRKLILDTAETILAVVLIILLLAVVLGMPFGALYIGAKGLMFLTSSLLETFPQLKALVASASAALGLARA